MTKHSLDYASSETVTRKMEISKERWSKIADTWIEDMC